MKLINFNHFKFSSDLRYIFYYNLKGKYAKIVYLLSRIDTEEFRFLYRTYDNNRDRYNKVSWRNTYSIFGDVY